MSSHRDAPAGPLRWTFQLAVWIVLLGLVAVLLAAVVVPRLAGATPYTVLTGSMAPAYPPGTLVVARPTPPEDIAVGDVITYQLESGRQAVVTHRVVAAGLSIGSGERVFTTRGDANGSDDVAPVRAVQVRGELWYAVPYVGQVNQVLSGSARQVAVNVAAAGLIGYALWMFVGSLRGENAGSAGRRRREGGQ